MSKKKRFITIFFSVIFLILVILNYQKKLSIVDEKIYNCIIYFKSSNLTHFFKSITMFGGFVAVLVVSDIIIIINRKKGLYFILNAFIILVLNTILKNIFMVERPTGINLITESGYSFPSAHSMIAVGVYGLGLIYLYNYKINRFLKVFLMIVISTFIIIIPVSRVYLGVHFFSDIFAGMCLSIVWLSIYTEILRKNNIL